MEDTNKTKMPLQKRIGKWLAGTALALSLTGCAGIETTRGFNAVYLGRNVSNDQNHSRVYTNVGVKTSDNAIGVKYHGFNQANDFDVDTYFGRHVFGIESGAIKDGLEAVLDFKTTSDGLLGQHFYGFRDFNAIKHLGADYGFTHASTNGEDVNITLLYGKSLGAGFTGEIFNSFDSLHEGNDRNLTELILQKNFTDNFGLFIRQDTHDFDFHDSQYIIGGVIEF